ncbi:MAG: hypothetical protein QOD92_3127 [Acidimicrobiaceae bacterium]
MGNRTQEAKRFEAEPSVAVYPCALPRGSRVVFTTKSGGEYTLDVLHARRLWCFGVLTRLGDGPSLDRLPVRVFRKWRLQIGTRPRFLTDLDHGSRKYLTPTEIISLGVR